MIIVAIFVVVFSAAWVSIYYYRASRFQKRMKVGDFCHFYVGLDRHEGRIAYIQGEAVVIKYIWGTATKPKKEVYP